LIQHAQERILLGWGGWGRALLYDDQGNQLTIQDSLWVIAFGHHGLLGLISLYTTLLLPVVSVFLTKCPPRLWDRKEAAPIAVLAVTLLLYSIDCLLNAMINPIFILMCGGLTGYVMRPAAKVSSQLPQRTLTGVSTGVSKG
ncbi:MAG: O-antigen ligase domain-containing protein, partial [Nodosilinea sp.]